jgi:hypothetical protein
LKASWKTFETLQENIGLFYLNFFKEAEQSPDLQGEPVVEGTFEVKVKRFNLNY